KIRTTDSRTKPFRTWLTQVGTTADGSKKVKELFDGDKVFDFPKPIVLLKLLINIGTTDDESLILDFFAGSCSTAHAVMDFNKNNQCNHKFICIQLNESCEENSDGAKLGYRTISEIGKERMRRVIKQIKQQSIGLDFG